MEFEGRRRTSHVPNLTPLIDVVFLLLVFFMLTAHFVRDESISIDLPQAESSAALDPEKSVEVVIDQDGRLLFDGAPRDADALETALRHVLESRSKKIVTLRGDRKANLGATVTALDAARKAGADSVDIITSKPPQ